MDSALKFFLVIIIINIFWSTVSNYSISKKSNTKNTVKMYKWTFWIGFIGNIEMGIALYYNRDIESVMIFSSGLLISLFILLSYFNNRIYYNEDTFIYKNFLGKKNIYTYDKIQKFYINKNNIRIITDNKKIEINLIIGEGAVEFYKFIQNKKKRELDCGKKVGSASKKIEK